MARRITRKIVVTKLTAVTYDGTAIAKEEVEVLGHFKSTRILENRVRELVTNPLVTLENVHEEDTIYAMSAETFVANAVKLTAEEAEAEAVEQEEAEAVEQEEAEAVEQEETKSTKSTKSKKENN